MVDELDSDEKHFLANFNPTFQAPQKKKKSSTT